MARRPTQFGTAQVKQKDAVRPLLVLLLIGAGGIVLFLWLQADTVDPVVAVAAEPEESADAPTTAKAAAAAPEFTSVKEGLEEWWFDAESRLLDSFEGLRLARDGNCEDLEYALSSLGELPPPREQAIRAPFSAAVLSFDRALAGCRSDNSAIVDGGGRAAREQVKTLTKALQTYGLPPSSLLSEI